MRCFNCHRFGHSKQSCRRKAVCAHCGKEGHDNEKCSASPHCLKCHGEHSASSKECPKWQEEKAILTHKAQYGGTFAEAHAALFPRGTLKSRTYAKVVQQGQSKNTTELPLSQPLPKHSLVKEKREKTPKTQIQISQPKSFVSENKFSALHLFPSTTLEDEGMDFTSNSPSPTPKPTPPIPLLSIPFSSPPTNKLPPDPPEKSTVMKCPSVSPQKDAPRKSRSRSSSRSLSRSSRTDKHPSQKDGSQPSPKKP